MNIARSFTTVLMASVLVLTGCATSPEEERKREEMEADVDDILSQELDPDEYGEVRSCLRDSEAQSYSALGKRHMLFKGRQGKQWVNVLRGRCPGLNDNSVFIMRPRQAGRLCDQDRFNVVDSFSTMQRADAAPTCVLGEFRPVTQAQVDEVQNRLEMR